MPEGKHKHLSSDGMLGRNGAYWGVDSLTGVCLHARSESVLNQKKNNFNKFQVRTGDPFWSFTPV